MVTVSQICGGWWKPSQQTNPWPCLPVAASREWSYVHSYMCVWVSYIHSYVCVCVYTQSLSHVWPLESGVIYIVICVCVCVCVCTLSCVWLFVIPCTVSCQAPLSMEFSKQEYWNKFPFPLQGIFPTQRLNPHFSISCAGRHVLYKLSHQLVLKGMCVCVFSC